MKKEDAIKILKGYKQRLEASCSNQLDADKEAFDFAINAIETGEIYMTGKDYNLFLEGYKQGKKDFEKPQGDLADEVWKLHERYCSNLIACVTEFNNELNDLLVKYQQGGKKK